jgi:hypothetical protein
MKRVKRFIDIEEIEKYYTIEEDGMIWSKKKNAYLKPTKSYCGYLYVSIKCPDLSFGMLAVHRLVACKYIGQCPPELETSHKDGNKFNNHYTNLEYITHSENCGKAYSEHGRIHTYYGHPPTVETKLKMANAKKIPIVFVSVNNKRTVYPSVQDAADALKHTRASIWLCINMNRPVFDKKRKVIGSVSYLNKNLKRKYLNGRGAY